MTLEQVQKRLALHKKNFDLIEFEEGHKDDYSEFNCFVNLESKALWLCYAFRGNRCSFKKVSDSLYFVQVYGKLNKR